MENFLGVADAINGLREWLGQVLSSAQRGSGNDITLARDARTRHLVHLVIFFGVQVDSDLTGRP